MKGPPLQGCICCVTLAFSRAILLSGQKSSLILYTTPPNAARLPRQAISLSSTQPRASITPQNAPAGPGFSRKDGMSRLKEL
jgi:hypothetical protein